MSIIRDNLMKEKNYTPYCGNTSCSVMPRSFFNGSQFQCSWCGWQSKFDDEFISQYKAKWGKQ